MLSGELMRFERPGLVLILGLAVGASACGSVLVQPTDAGQDGSAVACRQLGEAACRSRSDCAVGACSSCSGGSELHQLLRSGERAPARIAPASPVRRSARRSMRRRARRARTAASTPVPAATAAARSSAAPPPMIRSVVCPAIPCPAPCAAMTSEGACEARPECHSVFVDDRDCQCAALGCCARFSRCADGASAVCKAPAITCDAVTPHCEGPYVVAYSGSCYEGCVQSSDCAVELRLAGQVGDGLVGGALERVQVAGKEVRGAVHDPQPLRLAHRAPPPLRSRRARRIRRATPARSPSACRSR